jgi:hypothetical protein
VDEKYISLKGGNMFMSLYVGNPMSVVYTFLVGLIAG